MSRENIKLVIIEDQLLIMEGLCKICEETPDIKVVGQANNGKYAIDLLKEKNPDVILLDMDMPVINGLETLRMIKKQGAKGKVIMLSDHNSKNHVIEAMEIGAKGYISKNASSKELIKTIRYVHSGNTYIQPNIKNDSQGADDNKKEDEVSDKIKQLSKREYEILYLLASGYKNKEIGDRLFISEKTVKNHITSIYKKLGVEGRVQAVIFAYTHQIKTLS